ncbi:MAG: hypothetical protein J3K34DRAFT_117666 [Monoraphidium minutum]|nr:MAG: hypothetical protein J3K34DRAFT_117666 [Monoraphidium minutum]
MGCATKQRDGVPFEVGESCSATCVIPTLRGSRMHERWRPGTARIRSCLLARACVHTRAHDWVVCVCVCVMPCSRHVHFWLHASACAPSPPLDLLPEAGPFYRSVRWRGVLQSAKGAPSSCAPRPVPRLAARPRARRLRAAPAPPHPWAWVEAGRARARRGMRCGYWSARAPRLPALLISTCTPNPRSRQLTAKHDRTFPLATNRRQSGGLTPCAGAVPGKGAASTSPLSRPHNAPTRRSPRPPPPCLGRQAGRAWGRHCAATNPPAPSHIAMAEPAHAARARARSTGPLREGGALSARAGGRMAGTTQCLKRS